MTRVSTIDELSVDEAYVTAVLGFGGGISSSGQGFLPLQQLSERGYRLRRTEDTTSPDKDQPMLEQSAIIQVHDPRNRLIYSRPIDIFNLVGLWVYLMRGSARLDEIEFYSPAARRFTDEEVDSSSLRANWGERIFFKNSFSKTMELLKTSPYTRRAYLPVFLPEDIGFPSRNLPCLAGLQFAHNEDRLDLFTTMRSQSAVSVLPYDMFLLSMLHEYMAMRIGSSLGSYIHYAPLFGIRERELETFNKFAKSNVVRSLPDPMNAMMPLDAGGKALFLSAERAIRVRRFELANDLSNKLPEYWVAFLRVALARRMIKDGVAGWEAQIEHSHAAFPEKFISQSIEAIKFGLERDKIGQEIAKKVLN